MYTKNNNRGEKRTNNLASAANKLSKRILLFYPFTHNIILQFTIYIFNYYYSNIFGHSYSENVNLD